ncbi:MAG: hypothetical protein ACHQXA_07755 [Gemmatimonadales bacterium]
MGDWGSTERIESEILLGDGTRLVGAVFVQGRVPQHDGPESLVEMLNRPEPFTPVSLTGDGVVFLAKAQIALVAGDPAVPSTEVDGDQVRHSAAKMIGLEVEMLGGRVLRGWAALELPPNRARALDFLNEAGDFFALSTSAAHWVIHRAYVRGVRPLD